MAMFVMLSEALLTILRIHLYETLEKAIIHVNYIELKFNSQYSYTEQSEYFIDIN